jgi:hypothetical protein
MDDVDKETLTRMFGDIYTTCAALPEEVLARYAELEIAGQEPDKQMPEAAAHLDECPDCAGKYAELLAVLQAKVRGEVSAMSASRTFDLQFLSMSGLDLWSEVKEMAYCLVADVPIVFQRAVAAFGRLPTALEPCRVTMAAGVARDAVETTREIESLQIPDESASVLFTLTPGPVDADEKGVTVVLRVQDLQSGEPLGQVRVNLCDARAQLLQSKTTTADGRAVFRGLVGDYILRCKYADRTWDFPISLAANTSV